MKRKSLEKQSELKKYHELVLATIDYILENEEMNIPGFNLIEYYEDAKLQANEHFRKERLTKLKQWYRDLTEMFIENFDLKFNNYLTQKTKYEIDIFKSFFERIEKIIDKGKITADAQFYDVNIMINHLCQMQQVDQNKIEKLNSLLIDYERRKSGKKDLT